MTWSIRTTDSGSETPQWKRIARESAEKTTPPGSETVSTTSIAVWS
ncbi:hypothetical protein [Candidatus Thiodiazotropha sp. LNASS1]